MGLPTNSRHNSVGAGSISSPSTSNRFRALTSGVGSTDRSRDSVTIFKHKNHGNLAFSPQKVGKSAGHRNSTVDSRAKNLEIPEKPLSPYQRYQNHVWESIKEKFPDYKMWELGKEIQMMYAQLNEDDKRIYVNAYEKDKKEYDKAIRCLKYATAHQAAINARTKTKIEELQSSSQRQERRVDIQPAEDEDDDDDGNANKYVATQRFTRNNLLLLEIFSEAVVPDVRSVVTTQRMQVLKRQVASLTMHQTKLASELQQMEDKHELKKQKIMQSRIRFQEELERHCRPAVDEETVQKMADRMYDDMKREQARQRLEYHTAVAVRVPVPTTTNMPAELVVGSVARATSELFSKSTDTGSVSESQSETTTVEIAKPVEDMTSVTQQEISDTISTTDSNNIAKSEIPVPIPIKADDQSTVKLAATDSAVTEQVANITEDTNSQPPSSVLVQYEETPSQFVGDQAFTTTPITTEPVTSHDMPNQQHNLPSLNQTLPVTHAPSVQEEEKDKSTENHETKVEIDKN